MVGTIHRDVGFPSPASNVYRVSKSVGSPESTPHEKQESFPVRFLADKIVERKPTARSATNVVLYVVISSGQL